MKFPLRVDESYDTVICDAEDTVLAEMYIGVPPLTPELKEIVRRANAFDELVKLVHEVHYGPRGGEPGIAWTNRIHELAAILAKYDAPSTEN